MTVIAQTLVASDVDRTLVYSRSTLDRWGTGGAPLVAGEHRDGAPVSWLTAAAARELAALAARCPVVPVTTRTLEQWRRVRLPGPPPCHAVVANGGVLAVDGVPDPDWAQLVAQRLREAAPLREALAHLRAELAALPGMRLHEAAGLFCYAVCDSFAPGELRDRTAGWAAGHGWRVSVQGRKVYWVPLPLTKSAAVAEVTARVGCRRVIAAGDSLLDADLLAAADAAVVPRHGELVATGSVPDHASVTVECGVRAGEQVVRELARLADG